MVKESKKSVIPKLRFPEFRSAPGWTDAPLEELITTINPPAKLPSSNYRQVGRYPVVDQSQQAICGWTDDATAVVDEALPLIVFGDHTCALKLIQQPFAQGADGIKILKARASVSTEYLFQSLNHQPLLMEDYKRHFSILKERRVFYPGFETGEQQKIADCLTSLDELIVAQGRKVEALKTYKRGLMQQLFPRAGETLPSLRFPEFKDAGEWVGQILEELSKSISSGKDKAAPDGAFDLYGSTGIIGKTNSLSYSGIYLLVARVGANAGLLTKTAGEFGVTDNTLVIILKPQQNIDFVFYYLDQIGLNKMIFGSGQPLITGSQLKSLTIQLPKEEREQQRIASCLSSLDTLITAEAQKLEALKAHKKSLMQQLFPSLEEVEA